MGKPSRRRGNPRPRPPLQIRRSANRGRSRDTSSSKVEAASMSDKCEIQLDADPIQGTSSGPGQVSQVSNSSRPPLDLLNFPDEFKSLDTDRLLPCDFKNVSSSAMKQYEAYLEWFYKFHRGPVPVPVDVAASRADTASKYLEKENSRASLWVKSGAWSNLPEATVTECICSYMEIVIEEKGEVERAFAFDAAECLTKETELICEWLERGRCNFTDEEYALGHNIRAAAAELFITRRKWSSHISAALVGIRKEAEWLIENLKRNSAESSTTSMKIRQFALDFMLKKFDELEPCYAWGNKELSEVETASESDDDVADNNSYMGDCYDEVYMKLFR